MEDQFIAGYYRQVILDFGVRAGETITEDLLEEMDRAELRHLIKDRCFGWLARRAHSRKELLQKALVKKYPEHVIHNVLNELNDRGFIDDRGFAYAFATDKAKLYGWGPQKIRSALYQKGVQKRYIDAALSESVTLDESVANLYNEVNKAKNRFIREEELFKRKKKLVDFLYRKGYHLEMILAEVDSLLDIISNEEA